METILNELDRRSSESVLLDSTLPDRLVNVGDEKEVDPFAVLPPKVEVKSRTPSMTPSIAGSITPSLSRLKPTAPSIDPSLFGLATRRWTDATVFSDVPVTDLLNQVISKAFSIQQPQRHLMTVTQALTHADPFEALIESNSWRAVAILAKNDLVATHPMEVSKIMKLWHLRWTALLKLSLFEIVEKEVEKLKLHDLEALDYGKYGDLFEEKGCMVSFECLLIAAKVASYKGNHQESIHQMYKLLCPIRIYDFRPTEKQHYIILANVIGLLLRLQDYRLATELATSLSNQLPNNIDLLSMVGRLELQVGDTKAAYTTFCKIEGMLGINQEQERADLDFVRLPPVFERPDLILSNRGFHFFSLDNFQEAIGYFTDLLTLTPDSPSAINNLAMCHLYSGNVGQGSSFLESFMVTHPALGGTRPEILSNLSASILPFNSSV